MWDEFSSSTQKKHNIKPPTVQLKLRAHANVLLFRGAHAFRCATTTQAIISCTKIMAQEVIYRECTSCSNRMKPASAFRVAKKSTAALLAAVPNTRTTQLTEKGRLPRVLRTVLPVLCKSFGGDSRLGEPIKRDVCSSVCSGWTIWNLGWTDSEWVPFDVLLNMDVGHMGLFWWNINK